MITHNTETGWGFTHGAQSYIGYATREQAAEALYDLERGLSDTEIRSAFRTIRTLHAQNVAGSLARLQQPGDLVDATLAYVAKDVPPVTFQLQTLSDGSSPNFWDEYACGQTLLCFDEGVITLFCFDEELGERSAADLVELRAILNDPRVLARLRAELDGEPPVENPEISVERHDDYASPCTHYSCGGVTIEVDDEAWEGRRLFALNFGGDFILLEQAEAAASALRILLDDPRVKAAIEADRRAA